MLNSRLRLLRFHTRRRFRRALSSSSSKPISFSFLFLFFVPSPHSPPLQTFPRTVLSTLGNSSPTLELALRAQPLIQWIRQQTCMDERQMLRLFRFIPLSPSSAILFPSQPSIHLLQQWRQQTCRKKRQVLRFFHVSFLSRPSVILLSSQLAYLHATIMTKATNLPAKIAKVTVSQHKP